MDLRYCINKWYDRAAPIFDDRNKIIGELYYNEHYTADFDTIKQKRVIYFKSPTGYRMGYLRTYPNQYICTEARFSAGKKFQYFKTNAGWVKGTLFKTKKYTLIRDDLGKRITYIKAGTWIVINGGYTQMHYSRQDHMRILAYQLPGKKMVYLPSWMDMQTRNWSMKDSSPFRTAWNSGMDDYPVPNRGYTS